ncbi:MAG: hypothetical protein F6K39_39995 [Okeania sp. SIO3B3]|nr:hypothetical protein [Okeania sp. SIO3B3]
MTIEENLLPPASSISAFLPPKSNYSTGHDITELPQWGRSGNSQQTPGTYG